LGGGVAGGLWPLVASALFSFGFLDEGFARFVPLAGGLEGGVLDVAAGWAEEELLVIRWEDMVMILGIGREYRLGITLRMFM